jgi:hypothetical protein
MPVFSGQFSVVSEERSRGVTLRQISSTEGDSACVHGTLLFHSLNQPCEHALDFTDAGVECLLLFFRQESQVAGEQQEVFKFACRSERCVEELPKLRLTCPAATFGNVRRYGRRGTPHLASQTVTLRFRKGGRRRVDSQREGMAPLPYFQLSIVLHSTDNQLLIFSSDSQLKTVHPVKRVALLEPFRPATAQTNICFLPDAINHPNSLANNQSNILITNHRNILFSHGKLKTENCPPIGAGRVDTSVEVSTAATNQARILATNHQNILFSYGQLNTENCQPDRGAPC